MKKILIALCFLVGSTTLVNAQTTKKVEKKSDVKTSEVKASPASNSTVLQVTTVKKKEASKSKIHTKADGTPDKRFKENKTTTVETKGPVKKDGTLDKRYKVNKKG